MKSSHAGEKLSLCQICLLLVERKGQGSKDKKCPLRAHKREEHADVTARVKSEKTPKKTDRVFCERCGTSVTYYSLKKHQQKCEAGAIKGTNYKGEKIYSYEPQVDMPDHPTDPRKCPVPGCAFRDNSKSNKLKVLKRHFTTRHWKGDCPYCGVTMGYISLKMHVTEKHTQDKRWRCDQKVQDEDRICGESFTCRRQLMMHIDEIHIAKPIHVCDVCGKAFIVKRHMQTHRSEAHFRNRKHPCPQCGVVFRSKTLVAPHVQAVHPQFYAEYMLSLNDRKK